MPGAWIRRRRAQRRQRRAEKSAQVVGTVESALALADHRPPSDAFSTCAGIVSRHRQWARFGLKAYVRWCDGYGGEVITAVWFENSWPEVGSLVVASGRMGWGQHHGEPVFFCKVLHIVPRRVMTKYRRICTRRERRNRHEQKGSYGPTTSDRTT